MRDLGGEGVLRRLREAALKDAAGSALDDALRTVESFLAERIDA